MRKLQLKTMLLMLLMAVGGLSPAWAQISTWTAASGTYTSGQEITGNTAGVITMTLGTDDGWGYDTGRKGLVTRTQQSPTLTDGIPTAGGYVKITPTRTLNLKLNTYSSQSNCNVYLIEESNPSTKIKDFRQKAYNTNDYGTLEAGKNYYIYGGSFKAAGNATNLEYVFFCNFTATTIENYTIKYVDSNGAKIAEDKNYTGLYGATVTASAEDLASIEYDNKSYAYKSGNNGITLTNNAESNVITLVYETASIVNYTIKYVNDSEPAVEIKDAVEIESYIGASVIAEGENLPTYITFNDVKYKYSTGNTTLEVTGDAETDVITLVYTPAPVYSYSVNAYDGSENLLGMIASGSYVEGDDAVTVPYSQYLLSGTTLYNIANNGSGDYYRVTFTPDANDYEVKRIYSNGTIADVVFFSEGENISGVNKGTNIARASNGQMGYTANNETYKEVTTIEPGKYKIYVRGLNGNSATRTINFKVGENIVYTFSLVNGTNVTGNSDEFTVESESTLYFAGDGSSASGLDWFYIQKTGDYDTSDKTSLITNPSFETGNLDGWTAERTDGDTGVKTNVSPYTTEGIDGSYLFNTWNGDATGYGITQTLTALPAGYYKLEADFAGLIGSKVDLIAGDMTTTVTHTATGVFTTAEVLFHNAEAADVIIGTTNATGWYKVDNFRLHTITAEQYLAPIIAEYQNLRTTASTIAAMESGISTAYKTIAANAIAECDALNPSDESGYRTAIGALQKAIETAQKSIDAYNMIAAGTIPTDNAAGWNKTTTNGTLACNTLSTEGNSDGSGMTTPFIQNWVGAGNPLGEGQLSYTLEGLEPGEKYNVSALVRVFNEAEGSLEGASFFANNQSIDVDAEGNACTGDYATKGIYGTFTAKAVEVGEDGTLTFGIAIADGSLLNWVAIKNVTISEYANQKVESITLSQSSATITTGEVLTLTATVLPENADDKTYTWTSSDETVATVSAVGVVSALKAGTTTITATANDGSEVSGSCEITVADAPALAYNTAISGTGKYLLRNVATGKYLNAANAWGTQASLADHGVLFTATLENGTYKLTDFVVSSKGLGKDAYLDQDVVAVTVNAVEGKTNVYTLSIAEGTYLAGQAGSTVLTKTATDATNSLAQWQFISEDDMKKNMTTATAENPIDMTYFIMDPNFSRNNGYYNSWKWTFTNGENKNNAGDNSNFNVECYGKPFDFKQTITVPNGIYRVRAQAFYRQDGSDNENMPYIFANDEKVYFPVKTGTENSMSDASASFSNGLYYTDYATVTVTDHTLSVGAHNDNTGTLWCIWDNFSLEMIGYVPVTEITATIDKTEITEGNTAAISDIAIVPAAASFNALTFTSSDEAVATVNSEGVVSAIKAGTANITIAAEMENVTKVFAITVVEPVATPESIALKNGEAAAADMILHGSTLTATLTAKVLPEDAPQTVVWSSSDEKVATVVDGVITAVSTGEATITVKSTEDETISASINVNVYMFKNGSFEYSAAGTSLTEVQKASNKALTMYGWTQADPGSQYNNTEIMDANTDNSSAFGKKVTPTDGNYSMFFRLGWNSSTTADRTFTPDSVTLPTGVYTISYDYMLAESKDDSHNVSGTTLTFTAKNDENTIGSATVTAALNPGGSYFTNSSNWKTSSFTFALEEETKVSFLLAMTPRGGIRSDMCVDNFTITWSSFKDALGDAIEVANAVDVTTNVGEAAFQIPTSAATAFTTAISDAQSVYNDAEAAETDYLNAIKALATATSTWKDPELNAPAADKLYNIVISTNGHAKKNNPIIIIPGSASNNNPTGYSLNANFEQNVNLSQAFTFKKVEGNNYKISAKVAGADVYLTNGSLNGSAAGWKNSQIQATTDAEKAMSFKIASSSTEGAFNIYNTVTNSTIACQSGGNIYTEPGNADFSLVEVSQPAIAINTTAAGWGTVMLPFAQALPEGVKAYTCAATEGDRLTLTEVTESLEANKPYLVEGVWNETVNGDAQGTALNYTEGLFTGVYADAAAPVGSYVLQNKNEKLAFYRVAKDKQPTVKANRAYLTVEAASARDAFFFGEGETTAISTLKALSEGTVEIYSLNGVKQSKLQKGTNILKMSDGSIRKVMVK